MQVTKEQIDAKIKEAKFSRPHGTITIYILVLENGFTVQGMSACVDPKIFNEQTGERFAYEDAYRKIWQLEGYLLAEQKYQAGKA